MDQETRKLVLLAAFMAGLTCSVLISAKITTVAGLSFSVGALAYAVLFPITDVLSEVYGRKEANRLVYLGWLAYGIIVVFSLIAVFLPPADFWAENQPAFEIVIGLVPRFILASFVSYTVSQYHDVWAFHFWKRVTGGKHLWLRNNLSTGVSQLLDTVLFVTIAFVGVVPAEQMLGLVFGQYLVKLLVALVDTPVVYALTKWARAGSKVTA